MKIDFLLASIADTQNTIRLIDVRAGFLFVVLFLPLSMLDKISAIYGLPAQLSNGTIALILVNASLWVMAIVALFLCVVAIDDPSKHVSGSAGTGSFYGGDLFKLTKLHLIWNHPVLSNRDVIQELSISPSTDDQVAAELTFEKIKLAYIRSIKLKRFGAAAFLTAMWLIVSGSFAIYSRIFS